VWVVVERDVVQVWVVKGEKREKEKGEKGEKGEEGAKGTRERRRVKGRRKEEGVCFIPGVAQGPRSCVRRGPRELPLQGQLIFPP
jgi:hypothetical protein